MIAPMGLICVGLVLALALSGSFPAYLWIAPDWMQPSPLISALHNGYTVWRFDPVSGVLHELLIRFSIAGTAAPSCAILLSASAGCAVVFRSEFAKGLIAILTLTAVAAWNGDIVVLGAVAWLPVAWALLRREESGRPALLVVGALHFASAQQFSMFGALSLLALTYHGFPLRAWAWMAFPVVGTFFALPDLPFLDYPGLSHVVPDDGLPGVIRPLIGPDLAIPVIFRNVLESSHGWLAWTLFAAAFLASDKRSKLVVSGLAVAALLYLYLPPTLATITPLPSFSRIIPGSWTYPAIPVVLAIGLVLLSLGVESARAIALFSVFLAALCWGNSGVPARSLVAALHHYSFSSDEALVSPSLSVLNRYLGNIRGGGAGFTPERYLRLKALANQPYQSPPAGSMTIESEPQAGAKHYARVSDGNEKTRWITGSGGQRAGETLLLRFTAAMQLDGIELSTGAFHADFPRGFVVSVPEGCDAVAPGNSQELYRDVSWQGEIRVTPLGFLYHAGQSEVKIVFPATVTASCLTVSLTIDHDPFDWSVAEIRLLNPRGGG